MSAVITEVFGCYKELLSGLILADSLYPVYNASDVDIPFFLNILEREI
jgi:hypothetical protein